MATPESVAQLGQIFELQISVGMRAGRDLLLVHTQGRNRKTAQLHSEQRGNSERQNSKSETLAEEG